MTQGRGVPPDPQSSGVGNAPSLLDPPASTARAAGPGSAGPCQGLAGDSARFPRRGLGLSPHVPKDTPTACPISALRLQEVNMEHVGFYPLLTQVWSVTDLFRSTRRPVCPVATVPSNADSGHC